MIYTLTVYPVPGGERQSLEHLNGLLVVTAAALGVPTHLARVGLDRQEERCIHLALERADTQGEALATARNLLDRLPTLLPPAFAETLYGAMVTWQERHAGIGILGLTNRAYELGVVY